jgi:hypothetical protein
MLVQQADESKGGGPLRRAQVAVQRVPMGGLEVIQDQPGIGDHPPIILDIGELALGRLRDVEAVLRAVRQTRHAEIGLHLHAERAGVGKPVGGRELV